MNIKEITLTTTEESVLKNDLVDVQDWVEQALGGKVNNCKLRMIDQWRPILNADDNVKSVPANDDDLIALIVARSDYKTAAVRAEESKTP